MSAPESYRPVPASREAGAAAGVSLASVRVDLIELAALRGRAGELAEVTAARGIVLPRFGRVAAADEGLILSVRPERWWLLSQPGVAGARAAAWQARCAGCAAGIDLSAAWEVLHLGGTASREALRRGCRLDLHPDRFSSGHAAASVVAQVPVVIVALRTSLLLITPATTARHFREWIAAAAQPFGFQAHTQALESLPSQESPSP